MGRRRVILIAIAVALVAMTVAGFLYVRGGGPLPSWLDSEPSGLLDPSGPEEAVLRTLRLAGYDHAAVGFGDGTVVVRVDVPYVRTAADVELSWQTALGAALGAWPDASRYVAQVFADGTALVELGIDGDDLREIAAADGALVDPAPATEIEVRADVRLLSDQGIRP